MSFTNLFRKFSKVQKTWSSNGNVHIKNECDSIHQNCLDDISVHAALTKYPQHIERQSKLKSSLYDTMRNKDSLTYFLFFAQSIHISNLVKFWLDVNSLKTAMRISWKATTITTQSFLQTCQRTKSNMSCSHKHLLNHHKDKTCNVTDCNDLYVDNNNGRSEILNKNNTNTYKIENINKESPSICPNDSSTYINTDNTSSSSDNSSSLSCASNSIGTYGISCAHSSSSSYSSSINDNKSSTTTGPIEKHKDLENEVLLIFTKYLSGDQVHGLDIPSSFKNAVAMEIDHHDNLCDIASYCFDDCQAYVYDLLERKYYHRYIDSPYHLRQQLDLLTSSNLSINDLIFHQTALSYFTEFMDSSNNLDYLQCFLDIDNFHQHYYDINNNNKNNFLNNTNNNKSIPCCKNYFFNNINNNSNNNNNNNYISCTNTNCESTVDGNNNKIKNNDNNNKINNTNNYTNNNNNNNTNNMNNCNNINNDNDAGNRKAIRNKSDDCSVSLAQEDAMILYNKFFSMQAKRSLNIMDGLRLDLEESICKEGGPSWQCFDLLRAMLLLKMEQVHLPLFLKSDIYHKYLLELIHSVQNFNFITDTQRPTKLNESESIDRIDSSWNTLLAVNTYNMRASKSSINVGENTNGLKNNNKDYDSHNARNNPYKNYGNRQDNISGKNKSKSELQLGHVTKLGQYVSDYEPNPESDKKTTGIFSKRHKKKEEDEEAAVRMAEEILRDIQLITSHHADGDNKNKITNN